jgi:hypothetical protein
MGISTNAGHAMTYKILCDKSLTVLHWSNLRSANNPSDPNLRLDPLDGDNLPQSPQIVKSAWYNAEDVSDQVKPMIYFNTGDLVRKRSVNYFPLHMAWNLPLQIRVLLHHCLIVSFTISLCCGWRGALSEGGLYGWYSMTTSSPT